MKLCRSCNTNVIKKSSGARPYKECETCILKKRIELAEQLATPDMARCSICNMPANDLTSHITRIHKLKISDYKEK